MVCERAEEGDDLRERWAETNWSALHPLSFLDTQAALCADESAASDRRGSVLAGSED